MRHAATSALTAAMLAVAVTAGTVTAPAATAVAASTDLALPAYTGMAVDEDHDRVLVASGSASSELTVLGLDGTPRPPIGGMAGAEDIHLSADGSVFHVALKGQRAIGLVDAATLEVTKVPLGAGVCPTTVAEQGDVLWFTYTDCASTTSYGLGSLQPADETVTLSLAPDGLAPWQVKASPALPGRIVARTYRTLTLLDVTAGPTAVPTLGPAAHVDGRDFAIAPDGQEIVATDYDTGYRHIGFSTETMQPRTMYDTAAYPNAVAVRADGLVAAGISDPYGDDLYIFDEGSPDLYRTYDVEDRNASVATRGLQFGAVDLYVVTDEWYGGEWVHTFQRITPRKETTMTLTRGRTTYGYDAAAKLTVHLSVPGGVVRVYTTPWGGTRKFLTTAPVDENGNLTVSTRVRVRTKFSVYYDGDAVHDRVSKAVTVAVRAKVTAKATKVVGRYGAYHLVKVRSAPRVYATVRPYHVGQCVRYELQQYSSRWRTTHTTGCLRLNAYSKTYIWFDSSWKARERVRLRVLWGGDTRNAASRSSWLYLRFVA